MQGVFKSQKTIHLLTLGQGDMYGPQMFIDYDIIIVTVNYRLGPLGQLSLNTEQVSGNQGLRDQTLALKWIQENIEYFGGDKDKVTIFKFVFIISARQLYL